MGVRLRRALGQVVSINDVRVIAQVVTLATLGASLVIGSAAVLGMAVHVFRMAAG